MLRAVDVDVFFGELPTTNRKRYKPCNITKKTKKIAETLTLSRFKDLLVIFML
jgi:hypothetical protein